MPPHFDFYWQPPEPQFDIARAKQLLAEAGHPNGVEGGPYYCDSSFSSLAEAIVNSLREAGIRTDLRPLERAAFFKGYSQKSFNDGLIQGASAAFGNAATRMEAFVVKGGAYAYGNYPDLTSCSPSRRSNSITPSARRCCTRCSSSCTKRRSPRRSGSWPG